jgi:multidrug efflux system membrane fusion protein
MLGPLLTTVVGCTRDTPPPELPPRAIQWERVSDSFGAERRVISGVVRAIKDTRLAFEVNGTVKTVEVNLGDTVEQGQVLARLDPEPLELAVQDAEAELDRATALLATARSTLSRFIAAGKAVPEQDVDQARAQKDSKASQYEAAQAHLGLAQRDLRRSVLKAPFSGTISTREVDPAMRVAAGETVFDMDSSESGLRVEVQMPETLIRRVLQGDKAEVSFPVIGNQRLENEDQRFGAVVSEVGTRAGAGNAFPVRADLVDPPPGLRPGMTAEVTFSVARQDSSLSGREGLLIPLAAAHAEPNDSFSVFVFDAESSTVSKRAIRTSGVADNDIAVFEGLEEGDIIATAGVSFLSDGQRVTLLEDSLNRSSR